jgi:hypothetical protein
MAHTISSNNQHEPNQHARLDAVPEDIQYIIASELEECSPSTVLFLAQTSHTLRQAALPVVYRDIVLTRGPRGSQSEKSYRAFIEMLQNDFMCHIARHFRGITVTDEIPEKDLITILDRIAERGTLQRLRYEHLIDIQSVNTDFLVGKPQLISQSLFSINYKLPGRSSTYRFVFSIVEMPHVQNIARWTSEFSHLHC